MNAEECYQRTCSDVVNSNQLESLSAKIYILRTFGPLAFLLKEDGEEKNFKTYLGRKHSCSCNIFLKTKELCKHICWLLLKKFSLTMKDPLSWQKGMTEREIDDLLCKLSNNATAAATSKRQTDVEQSTESVSPPDGTELNTVPQREIDEDSVCPICLDNLLKSHLPVTYCRYGCGNNIHIKCMRIHAEHQRTSASEEKDAVMCPMCRGVFISLEKLKIEERNSLSGVAFPVKHYHYGIECSVCHLKPIIGNCYKCTVCSCYHLCQHCFNTSVHEEHQFKFRQKRIQKWKKAERSFNYSLPEALIKNLMKRELRDDDYDKLLQLDSEEFTQFNSLSEKIIESLPLETVTGDSVLLSTGAQCHICLKPFHVSTLVRRLPCRHKFHRECIDNWLLHSHSVCPIDGTNAWNANTVSKKNKQKCQSKKKEPPWTEELSLNILGLSIHPESQHKLALGKTKKSETMATKPESSFKESDTYNSLSLAGINIKVVNRNSSPSQKSSCNSDNLSELSGNDCPSISRRGSLVLPPLRAVRKKILRHSANSITKSHKNFGNNGIDKILQVFKDQKLVTDSLDHWLLSAPNIPKECFVPALDHLVNQLTKIKCELEAIKNDPPDLIEEIPSTDKGDACTEMPQAIAQTSQEAAASPLPSTSGGQETNSEVDSSVRKTCIDKNLIQITASKSEINRRIAAFIEQKRLDVDEENKREFCSESFPYHMEKEHCARTGAVFVPRSGTRSHVTVSRVENINGPQLHIPSSVPSFSLFSKIKQETEEDPVAVKQEPSNMFSGIEERVSNMAAHLHIESDESKKSQIFETLKQLEKKILFLESLSPEYFEFHNQLAVERKRKQFGRSAYKSENPHNQDLSIWEINRRMKTLRESLKQKRMKAM